MRPIGTNQRGFLRAMKNHSADGLWYTGCGWIWGSVSESERIANSLVRRGLVRLEEKRFPARFGGEDRVKNYYYLTDAGTELAK